QKVQFNISPAQLHPGEKGVLQATLIIQDSDKKQSYDPSEGENGYLTLKVIGSYPQLNFESTKYPEPDKITDGIWEYYGKFTLKKPFVVKADARPGKLSIKVELQYGLCHKSSGFCDPPQTVEGTVQLEILPTATLAESENEQFIEKEQDTLATNASVSTKEEIPSAPVQKEESGNILIYMLLAILGGIVLNFTPCVLPILPIRAMSMINQAQKDITKLMIHTLLYTLGVLLSFGAIAAVFVIARASGVNLTYGFLSQSVTYNLIMMSILFLFGLSLLNVWEMTLPGMNAAAKATSKGGYIGSFFNGVFAFLMGFSCMGPFMGPALEVAFRLSSPMLVLFFLLIGFGFALPFIIISLFPKALKALPKPGEWMNIFKEAMGFVLLWLTWKYVSNIWSLTKSGPFLINTLLFIFWMGVAAWLYGRFVRPQYKKWVQFLLGFAAIAIIIWSASYYLKWEPEKEVNKQEQVQVEGMQPAEQEGWYVFTPELFYKLQEEGKPVYVEIGAAWCTNCKTNEKK
ncbi:MAG TPA: cytochrome c biogenesis protein CcdA, partial [Candidatus Syntrophosphaera thermopropionivorans]|nr:cytochrome c biogenesis protein CcdA [Candidatus Syntrophosphaera thermopropionivorans]